MCSSSTSFEDLVCTYDPHHIEEHSSSSDFDYQLYPTTCEEFEPRPRKGRNKKTRLVYSYSKLCFLMDQEKKIMDKTEKDKLILTQNYKKIEELGQELKDMDKTGDIRVSPSKWAIVKRKVASVLNLFSKRIKNEGLNESMPTNDEEDSYKSNICKYNELERRSQESTSSVVLKQNMQLNLTESLQIKLQNNSIHNNLTSSESYSPSIDSIYDINRQKIINHTRQDIQVCQLQQCPSIDQNTRIKIQSKYKSPVKVEKGCYNITQNTLPVQTSDKRCQQMDNENLVHNCIFNATSSNTKCYLFGFSSKKDKSNSSTKSKQHKSKSKTSQDSVESSPDGSESLTPKSSKKGKKSKKNKKKKGDLEPKPDYSPFPSTIPLIPMDSMCHHPERQGHYCPKENRQQCTNYPDRACNPPKTQKIPSNLPEYVSKSSVKSYGPPPQHLPTASESPVESPWQKVLPSPSKNVERACQQPHDAFISSVRQKYGGEVVCIHNPPALLINGCLHFPTNKPPPTSFSLADANLYNASNGSNAKNVLNMQNVYNMAYATCERSCQLDDACSEVQECQTSIYKIDKMQQSPCSHYPPCELMPSCMRRNVNSPSYDSCDLMKTCKKSFGCYKTDDEASNENINIGQQVSSTVSDWKKRHVIYFTANENASTQVKPKIDRSENYCVHVPICQKLPECCILAKNYFSSLQQASLDHRTDCLRIELSTIHSIDLIPTKDDDSTPVTSSQEGPVEVNDHNSDNLIKEQSEDDKNEGNEKFEDDFKVILACPKSGEPLTSVSNVGDLMDSYLNTAKSSLLNSDSVNESVKERGDSFQVRVQTYDSVVEDARSPATSPKLVALIPKENVSVQAQFNKGDKKLICRHHPPCIKIPKCLGQSMKNGLMSFDEIPNCNHRPFCELIPACCRKNTKDVVSIGSQYPASCRVS